MSRPCTCAILCHGSAPPKLAFFFNDTTTAEIYTLSLHDALPISVSRPHRCISSLRGALGSHMSNPAVYSRAVYWRGRMRGRVNRSPHTLSHAVFYLRTHNEQICLPTPRYNLRAASRLDPPPSCST